ncbi:MAG: vitamin B12 dependent-methionine synthase activation domain-containing protein [Candidatus Aminicenantaceae bacterium]
MFALFEKIEDLKIDIDDKRILRLIGYKKKSNEIKGPIKKLIAEEKNKLNHLLHPASIYTIINYEQTNKHPIFENAEKVVLCICTIGPELETEIKKLMQKNEMLKALILDAFGSEAAEEVAVQSDIKLVKRAREMNLWPSKRFSPGYRRWDIKEQRYVFHMLPGQEIGVSLTEACMMIPRKSVSFRINFYKDQKLTTRKRGL